MSAKAPISLGLDDDTPSLARKLDFDSYDDVSHTSTPPKADTAVVPLDVDNQNPEYGTGAEKSAVSISDDSDSEAAFKANLPALRYTALSFFVMFSAFQTCQTMVTSMFTDVGNISLAVLYSFYSLTCLLGPSIVEAFGIKRTICASGILYVVWVAATIPGSSGLFVFASALVGCGSGPIWIAQGVWMSLLSKGKDTGRYNGSFLSIFFLSACGGNLFTGLMFLVTSNNGSSAATSAPIAAAVGSRPPLLMLLALVAVCAAGCAMLFFMPTPEDPSKSTSEPRTPLLVRLKMTWSVTKERRTMYLHIYYLWIGIGIAFGWSRVPSLMPIHLVPWSMVLYGVGLFIGSMTLGRVFDQRGAMPLVIGNIVLAAIAYGIVFIVPAGLTLSECWPFFIVTFCQGAIEALLNVLCQSIILKYWEGARVACSFSIFRVVTGVSVSCSFFILQLMSTTPYMLMSAAFLLAGCASIAYHELKVAPMVPTTVVVRPVTEADAEPQP